MSSKTANRGAGRGAIYLRLAPLEPRAKFGRSFGRVRLGFLTGLRVVVYVAAACLGGASFSFAQEFRASIIGQVSDPSGTAVPGATVKAVQHDTRQAYAANADSAGVFSVSFILPGEFTVTVEAPGFSQKVYPDVTLEAGQKLNLNVTLAVGSVHEQVTVDASPGLLDTSDATGGGVLNQAKLENVPNIGRTAWVDSEFVQGVTMIGVTSLQGALCHVGTGPSTVNGSPTSTNSYFVNGAPVSNGGTWNYSPSPDAIEQVQVTVNGGAEYGPAAGGVFNSVIKQGTNRFHGSIFDYYGNIILNANSYQSNVEGIPRDLDPNTRNNFGGQVGGPILKDKTFFFSSFEGFRQNQPLPETDSVPTAAMRAGNFTGTGYTIYNPATVTCITMTASGCSTYGRSPFPNNTIPQNLINPTASAIMALYPLPNLSGITSNYVVPGPRSSSLNSILERVDHSFSDKTRLYGMFTRSWTELHGPVNVFPNVATTNYIENNYDLNAIADINHIVSPTMVVDLTASFGRFYAFYTVGQVIQQNYSLPGLTMPVIPTTTHQNLAPTIAATNYTSLFGDTANGTVGNMWYLSPSVAQIKGRHSLHYGFQFMDNQSGATGVPGTPSGAFTFGGNWTQANPLTAQAGSGNAMADLLLGYPASGSVGWGANAFITYHYYAGYLQDTYKVRENLTLSLGLRWDTATSPAERHNGINGSFCFTCTNPYTAQINYTAHPTLENPLTGGYLFPGVSEPHAYHNVPSADWQPRVGIAWAITPKTVFRAGYGIYFDNQYPISVNGTSYAEAFTYATSVGFSNTTSYIGSLNGNVNPTNYFSSGRPFPNGAIAPTGASQGLQTGAGNAANYYSPSGSLPWTQHWSVGFQRELPKKIVLDVEYAGSHTRAISVAQPWGVISSAQQAACFANNAVCNAAVPNPFYGILPAAATLGASATLQAYQLMRPQPLFNGVTQGNDPVGYSQYNALQVRFERKIKSLDFVVNYAYANWMDTDSYLNSGNFVDSKLYHGLDSNDVRHFMNSNVIYPLPVGKGQRFLQNAHGALGAVINDWKLDSVLVLYTGTPLAIPSANLTGAPGCTSYVPAGDRPTPSGSTTT